MLNECGVFKMKENKELKEMFLAWLSRHYPPNIYRFDLGTFASGEFKDDRVQIRWDAYRAGYEASKVEG